MMMLNKHVPSSSLWCWCWSLWWMMGLTGSVSSFGVPHQPSHHHHHHHTVAATTKATPPATTTAFVGQSAWLVRGGSRDASSSSSSSSALSATTTTTTPTTTTDEENLALLSERGRAAVERLMAWDAAQPVPVQTHVYGNWPPPGTDDEHKQALAEQLADLDAGYPGGLANYLTKAQALLQESADGVNPFADFTATVPEGQVLEFGSPAWSDAEQCGFTACASQTAFVLVAGGLGERLGYSGIKVSLETNLATNECYLEFYIRYLQALQERCAEEGKKLPLIIMTSGDTDAWTRQLLSDHDNFGLDADQLIIMTQDKVAALQNGQAGLATDGPWAIQTKPHGHGDVHQLLVQQGVVDKLQNDGISHVVFLQDTNALVVNSILPALGVSHDREFHMNSICIPRLAGEAAGAIAKLEHKTDPSQSLVINVEYNQLDPLLQAQGTADVPDEATGYSPFPGNANNLVLRLEEYAQTLRGEDQGVVIEFVNPKYKDETRTDFKKPTRLECMMQDIPKLFQKELGAENTNIGFCMLDRWLTFSPAKNSLESGQEAVAKGSTAPATLSSAESDFYVQNQRKLKFAGVSLPEEERKVTLGGIPVTAGPRVVLGPSFALTQDDLQAKLQGDKISVTERSSLVVDGQHVRIEGLTLDGALVLRCGPETHVTVQDLVVTNAGWTLEELDPSQTYPEEVAIRGYTMTRHETAEYILTEPGHFVIDAQGQVNKVEEK